MKTKLNHIAFEITTDCILKCRYCYNIWKREGISYDRKNSYTKALKTLKQLLKVAELNHIAITGGEPMMAERFEEIVLFCRMKNIGITLITNGNFASHNEYKTMMDLGVGLFEIPIHSHLSKVHDFMTRVEGSHQKAVSSCKYIIENGGYVVPVIVLTQANYKHINETLKYIKSLGMDRIMMNRYNIGGSGIGDEDNLLIDVAELRNCYKNASQTAYKLDLNITSNVCTPFCLINPEDYPNIGFGACSPNVIQKPLTLDIDGNLRLCNHSPIVAGNIYKNTLDEIFQNDYTKSWETIKPEFCVDCKIYEKCFGGCRAASEQMGLTLKDVDPILLNKISGIV